MPDTADTLSRRLALVSVPVVVAILDFLIRD
jgi:hypothetical protein